MSRLFTLVALSAVALPADACRCVQRNLAEYFDAAHEVVMGRLISAESSGAEASKIQLTFDLPVPAYKSQRELNVGDRISYMTAASSAACGIPPDVNATYILFATESGESSLLQIDTCSGSRVLLSSDGKSQSEFQDVPARFIPQQLNALAALPVIQAVIAAQPNPLDPDNEQLIGLLDVAGFSHAGHALLLENPDRSAKSVAKPASYEEIASREVGYEVPAAEVFAVVDGWYRLKTKDGGYGWLPPDYAGTFFPYEELLIRRLAYIPLPWHGFVWPHPGAGLPLRMLMSDGKLEQPVEILESATIGDALWFRVNLLPKSPCDGGETARGTGGWIPAYAENGAPVAWFYSRGC